jgi:hypothetical protein
MILPKGCSAVRRGGRNRNQSVNSMGSANRGRRDYSDRSGEMALQDDKKGASEPFWPYTRPVNESREEGTIEWCKNCP